MRVYKLELHDIAVEGLIAMMISAGQLTESQALDDRIIESMLAQLLEDQGARYQPAASERNDCNRSYKGQSS